MAATTEQEWEAIQEALVKGGLRETIDDIITARETPPEISRENRLMLAEAFRGWEGRFTLTTGDHYFAGFLDDELVVEGVEYNGVLHTIVHRGDHVEIMIGDEIRRGRGVHFKSVGEAWECVKEITA